MEKLLVFLCGRIFLTSQTFKNYLKMKRTASFLLLLSTKIKINLVATKSQYVQHEKWEVGKYFPQHFCDVAFAIKSSSNFHSGKLCKSLQQQNKTLDQPQGF